MPGQRILREEIRKKEMMSLAACSRELLPIGKLPMLSHRSCVLVILALFLAPFYGAYAQEEQPTPADSGWVAVPYEDSSAVATDSSEPLMQQEQPGTEAPGDSTIIAEPEGDPAGTGRDDETGAADTISTSSDTPPADTPPADSTGNAGSPEHTSPGTAGTDSLPPADPPFNNSQRSIDTTSATEADPLSPGMPSPADSLRYAMPGDTAGLSLADTLPPDPRRQLLDSLTSVAQGYDSALQNDPYDVEARINRGQVRSWISQFDSADADLRFALDLEPENIRALNALAYNHAWRGEFEQAEDAFRRSLEIAPDQIDAAKGMAYVSLWRGDAERAVEQFGSLANFIPEDPELQVGLGRAQLQAGRTIQARNAFKRALSLDPARSDAREALTATQRNPTTEFTGWIGSTRSEDVGNRTSSSRGGIRFAEIATSPVPELRLWLQYDNGMTFDNISFALRYYEAPAYYFGGFLNYETNLTTRLEIGFRKMPGDDGQYLLRGEHVIGLGEGRLVKFGGWGVLFDDNPLEMIAHAAYGFPVNDRLRLEPTVIYSKTGPPGEFQLRGMLAGEYNTPTKWQIGGALVAGLAAVGPESTLTTLWDAYLRISAPISSRNRLHMLLRHESVKNFNDITVLAAGITLVMGGM